MNVCIEFNLRWMTGSNTNSRDPVIGHRIRTCILWIIQRNAIVKRRQFTAYSIESQTPDVLHFSLTEKKSLVILWCTYHGIKIFLLRKYCKTSGVCVLIDHLKCQITFKISILIKQIEFDWTFQMKCRKKQKYEKIIN